MPSPQQLACAAFVAGIVLPMYVLFFVALADVVNGLLQTACLAVAVALVRPAWRQEHGAVCALTSASALRPEGRNSAVKPCHPLCSWDAVPPHVDAAVSLWPQAEAPTSFHAVNARASRSQTLFRVRRRPLQRQPRPSRIANHLRQRCVQKHFAQKNALICLMRSFPAVMRRRLPPRMRSASSTPTTPCSPSMNASCLGSRLLQR